MNQKYSLTEGSVVKGLIAFLLPMIFGQCLQQLYNIADAWVIGNFADNASFAAVSSCGNLSFLIVGFFMGLANGAGVVIARYFGAKDEEQLKKSIHTTITFGMIACLVATVITSAMVRNILVWMKTPETVLPYSIKYFRIYCLGISTVILYNLFMALMRALGDSLRPLIFLCISSVINVALDLLFVAVFHKGVSGAAIATVIAQGLSALLCFIQMQRDQNNPFLHIHLRNLGIDFGRLKEILVQGFPTGLQNSALSLGNVVVQSHVNSFGEYAMAGLGAHAKIEGFVFIPVICFSMALSTFVSQNRGAKQWDRIKKGAIFTTVSSLLIAQAIGIVLYINAPTFLSIFTTNPDSIMYGTTFTRTVTKFYMALAFCHASSGILQGMGKSILAMVNMMSIWCFVRILYVTFALRIRHEFFMICWAYPITWMISTVIFVFMLWKQSKKMLMER